MLALRTTRASCLLRNLNLALPPAGSLCAGRFLLPARPLPGEHHNRSAISLSFPVPYGAARRGKAFPFLPLNADVVALPFPERAPSCATYFIATVTWCAFHQQTEAGLNGSINILSQTQSRCGSATC